MVGWDYEAYYDAVKYSIDNNITSRGELLTISLVELTRWLNQPFIYFLINSIVIIGSVSHLIKKYSLNRWMSFFIFFGFPLFYLNSFSVVRVFTAIGIVLIGLSVLSKRRLASYCIIILIASMFHKSAIFALIFPLFLYIQPSKSLWLILITIAPFMGELIISPLSKYIAIYLPFYSTYTKDTNVEEGTKAIILLVIFGILFTLFHRKPKSDLEDKYNVFYHIYMFGVFFYLLLLSTGTAAHRTSLYATILLIILLPNMIHRIRPLYLAYTISLLTHALLIISFFYTIYVGAETYIPYRMIFLQN